MAKVFLTEFDGSSNSNGLVEGIYPRQNYKEHVMGFVADFTTKPLLAGEKRIIFPSINFTDYNSIVPVSLEVITDGAITGDGELGIARYNSVPSAEMGLVDERFYIEDAPTDPTHPDTYYDPDYFYNDLDMAVGKGERDLAFNLIEEGIPAKQFVIILTATSDISGGKCVMRFKYQDSYS